MSHQKSKSCQGFRYDNRGLRIPCLGIGSIDVGEVVLCLDCVDLLKRGLHVEVRKKDGTPGRIGPAARASQPPPPQASKDMVVQVMAGVEKFEGMLGWVVDNLGDHCRVAFAWPDVGARPGEEDHGNRIVAADLLTEYLIPIGEMPIKLILQNPTSQNGTPVEEQST